MTGGVLTGRRILVAEDDYMIAQELVRTFQRLGAEIVGPAPTVARALALLETGGPLDGAVLDINLRDEMVFPVAEALGARGVPFVFATGYDHSVIPEGYHSIVRCEKPADPVKVARALFGMNGGSRPGRSGGG